ncbi:MAG: hypothetical protein JW931_08395 [Methanomicrobiaceae archaeon]|nr:hypothetical protein [Methanomicrobiaceae archaeon]
MNSSTIVLSALAVFVLFSVLGCGCTEPESSETGQQNTTVPVEEAWGQAAVALLEQYALSQPGWEIFESFNGTIVSKEPVMLYDSEGRLLYYRFPVVDANGESYLNYSVRMSANKYLGDTVLSIGAFVIDGEIIHLNSSPGGEVSGRQDFVVGSPVPEYGERYGRMMVDSWEIENLHAENVLGDLEEAGVDISKPLLAEDQDCVFKILIENMEKRKEMIREFEEKYQVEWYS